MLPTLKPLLLSLAGTLQSFLIAAIIFIPLSMLFAANRSQPIVHKGQLIDTLYTFFSPLFIYAPAGKMIGTFLLTTFYSVATMNLLKAEGLPLFAKLPLWFQVILILMILDFIQYWVHRLFHTKYLWRFHAIHHSAVHVDWLTSARFHPVNLLVYSTLVFYIVYMMGFSPKAWILPTLFSIIYSPLVHANLNWTYGPFRYLLASPIFHRWHHTYPTEGGNKNFAPNFPLLDVIFGTYYDPKDKKPDICGLDNESIPENIINHLLYPIQAVSKLSCRQRNPLRDRKA